MFVHDEELKEGFGTKELSEESIEGEQTITSEVVELSMDLVVRLTPPQTMK